MSDYISIDEIPHRGNATHYPYAEWLKIPEGKALEITEQLNGKTVAIVRTIIAQYLRSHDLSLVVMMRGERLFVARKP